MKKIKKIILAVIVSLIVLISVFSCFKGNNTPEPVLMPVSVLKHAKSNNDDYINPINNYDNVYFNWSLNTQDLDNIMDNIPKSAFDNGLFGYLIYADIVNLEILELKYIDEDIDGYQLNLNKFNIEDFSEENIEHIFGITSDGTTWDKEFGSNPLNRGLSNGVSQIDLDSFGIGLTGIIPVGQYNDILKEIISPTPFLFEGTSSSIAWTSSGLDNPNNIQNIYFNTNLTNQAIKNILDTYIGDTSGIDIFSYLDTGVRVRCHVINNSANAFIQIIGGSTIIYKWIYDPIDTDDTIWWYGIDPYIIDNGNVLISPKGIALEGFNIYELRALFSSSNDFTETPSGDSYEQGYQDGYTAGQTAGYNQGYTAGETAGYNQGYTAGETAGQTAGYNQGYTAGETAGQTAGYNQGYTAGETAGYNQGYLDGLDDGAGSNVNFQYIESVLTLIGNFLNIEILPNIKLSYALGIIVILSIISIIKMVVK